MTSLQTDKLETIYVFPYLVKRQGRSWLETASCGLERRSYWRRSRAKSARQRSNFLYEYHWHFYAIFQHVDIPLQHCKLRWRSKLDCSLVVSADLCCPTLMQHPYVQRPVSALLLWKRFWFLCSIFGQNPNYVTVFSHVSHPQVNITKVTRTFN